MRHVLSSVVASVLLSGLAVGTAFAAEPPHHAPDPSRLVKAEKAAMTPLAHLHGIWRGQAHIDMGGQSHTITQTERVGPLLDGAVLVMEGRGYNSDGRVGFQALGVVSYDPATKAYHMQSYAQGREGKFPLTLTDDGFAWEIKAGPTTIHYTATISDDTWHEVGVRKLPNGKSVDFFEMTLKRVGDTDWPAAGAVPAAP